MTDQRESQFLLEMINNVRASLEVGQYTRELNVFMKVKNKKNILLAQEGYSVQPFSLSNRLIFPTQY